MFARAAAPPALLLVAALAACGTVDPEAKEAVTELVNEPDGFTPTEDGKELEFGETAHVVTTSYTSGVPVYWDVVVGAPETLAPGQVEENVGRDPAGIGSLPPERVKRYRCFPVTFTARGDGLSDGDAPQSVALPSLTPVDDAGTDANFVGNGDERYCGTDPSRDVPPFTGDIRSGSEYTSAVVTWEGADDPGIVGTGVRLNTLISPRNPSQPAQAITWAGK